MKSPNQQARRGLTPENIEIWQRVQPLALPELQRSNYERRVSAVVQYAEGASLATIFDSTGVSRQQLHYLIGRCLEIGPDGKVMGFQALVPGKHVGSRRNNNPRKLLDDKPLPGALQALFVRYPEIRDTMYDLAVHGHMPNSKRRNQNFTWAAIHEVFTSQCEAAGICSPSYPFNSPSQGLPALRRWVRRVREEHQREREHGHIMDQMESQRNLATEPASHCYQRVECDGHYVDLDWVVEVPGLKGEGVVRLRVSRLWLIALIDLKSTAVLGYSVAFGTNYAASDVARAVRSSIVPWEPRQLSISTLAYREGECLPNALDPMLAFVCYDELWLDNAKSHLSELFLGVLERTVNAVPVFGPRHAPNVRPHIEGLFDLLEEGGIHMLDGTTGSNPKDTRRTKGNDTRHFLTMDLVLDLIDLLVVRYNTGIAPGTTISRLEVLRRAATRETTVLRRVPESKRKNCLKYDLYEIASIGSDRGRPVIRWRNARYFGSGLHSRAGIIGQEVLVMAFSQDIREIEVALLTDGTPLGVLEVERRWHNTPHSLTTRKEVRKAMTNSSFLRHAADLPRAMREHTETLARESSRQARRFARLLKEQTGDAPLLANDSGSDDPPLPIPESAQESLPTPGNEEDELESVLNRIGTFYR